MVDHIKVPHAWRAQELVIMTANKPTNEDRERERSSAWWRARATKRFLFSFGAYGCTNVLVYSDSPEDALEDAAGYLAEHAPGLITSDSEMGELYNEALDEMRDAVEGPIDEEDEDIVNEARERSEQDMIHTESGYLASWECHVAENPTRADMLNLLGRDDEAKVARLMARAAVALSTIRRRTA